MWPFSNKQRLASLAAKTAHRAARAAYAERYRLSPYGHTLADITEGRRFPWSPSSEAYRRGIEAANLVRAMWESGDPRDVEARILVSNGREQKLLAEALAAWERKNPLSWAV